MMANPFPAFTPAELTAALEALAPKLRPISPRAIAQPYPANQILSALDNLSGPLSKARAAGGALNIWTVAGLRRDEVRNAQALAGLWKVEFGGVTSRQFLTGFLNQILGGVAWDDELAQGYRITTEISPLGDRSDRVDLAVETPHHLVGIEIKIGAGLGPRQLERYAAAIETRARWRRVAPHLILLAPFKTDTAGIASASWADVARAAEGAAGALPGRNTPIEASIASFADHVRSF
jgi:hypothetical protein